MKKKEKIEKVENIIKTDNMTLSIQEMTKKNRLISYCTFLIKEYHEFITKKTSDGIPHYELKAKDKNLKEYKFKLATIENNGIPPKIEEVKKEEINENKIENKMKESDILLNQSEKIENLSKEKSKKSEKLSSRNDEIQKSQHNESKILSNKENNQIEKNESDIILTKSQNGK